MERRTNDEKRRKKEKERKEKERRREKEWERRRKGRGKKCRAAIEKDEIYLPVCTRASVDSISREVLYVSKPCNDSVITVKNTGVHSCIEEYTGCPVRFVAKASHLNDLKRKFVNLQYLFLWELKNYDSIKNRRL